MAITAWSAKVSSRAICALGEGAHLPAVSADRPDGRALPEQRHRQAGAHPQRARQRRRQLRLGHRRQVVDVHDRAVRDRPAGESSRARASGTAGDARPLSKREAPIVGAEPGDGAVGVALHAEDQRPVGAAQPRRALGDRVQHLLQVGGRAADRRQHLAGGRLLLQGLRAVSRLRSCSSVNSRAFSMAITAWSAKVCTSAIWRSVNGRTSRRDRLIAPDRHAVPEQRHRQRGAHAQTRGRRPPAAPPRAPRPGRGGARPRRPRSPGRRRSLRARASG